MTLVALVVASQVADGLGYVLAYGHGVEINPVAAAIDHPGILLALKVIAAVVLGLGSLALVRAGRRRGVAWLAVVGFVGAYTEVAAL